MNDHSDNENREENAKISSSRMTFERVIGYNLSEAERPEGLRVRFKVKVATGRQAAILDERQAEAIRGLLLWARQYRTGRSGDQAGSR